MLRAIMLPNRTWVVQQDNFMCEERTFLTCAIGNHTLEEHDFFFEMWAKVRAEKFNLVFDQEYAGFNVHEALKDGGQKKLDEIVMDFIEFRGALKADMFWQSTKDGTLDVFVKDATPMFLGNVKNVSEAIKLLKSE